jgi:hypothetical protein
VCGASNKKVMDLGCSVEFTEGVGAVYLCFDCLSAAAIQWGLVSYDTAVVLNKTIENLQDDLTETKRDVLNNVITAITGVYGSTGLNLSSFNSVVNAEVTYPSFEGLGEGKQASTGSEPVDDKSDLFQGLSSLSEFAINESER